MGLLDWLSSPAPGRDNVWRRLYDPGTAPNQAAAEGASMYDKPSPSGPGGGGGEGGGAAPPSVWDEVLKSRSFRERRFSDVDADGDGRVTAAELAAALPADVAGDARRREETAARMVAAADKDGDGAVSRREWAAAMDRHYGAS